MFTAIFWTFIMTGIVVINVFIGRAEDNGFWKSLAYATATLAGAVALWYTINALTTALT